MVHYLNIDEHALGQRLDNFLIKHLKGVPKSHIYRLIRKGEVRVNKGRKKAHYKLNIGDKLRVPPVSVSNVVKPIAQANTMQTLLASVLYEDDALVIINKPSGIASHGGSGISLGVIEALKQHYGDRLSLVHRLDKDTSGCLMLAKKRSALRSLQQQLRDHNIDKTYLTLVQNHWAEKTHTLRTNLIKNVLKSGERVVTESPEGKKAVSHFHVLENFNQADFNAALVEVNIETGRTHQIRVQAKEAGHPVGGDDKYGDKTFNQQLKKSHQLNRIFLHAAKLTFTHPSSGHQQTVDATLSDSLTNTLKSLKSKKIADKKR